MDGRISRIHILQCGKEEKDLRSKLQVPGMLLAAMAAGYVGGLMSQANTAAVAAISKPAISQVVRARKFEVVNADGKVRGVFGDRGDGPALELYDGVDKMRGRFCLGGGFARLELLNSGKPVGMFFDDKGDPKLWLFDSAGKVRAAFACSRGNGGAAIVGSDGRISWQAP